MIIQITSELVRLTVVDSHRNNEQIFSRKRQCACSQAGYAFFHWTQVLFLNANPFGENDHFVFFPQMIISEPIADLILSQAFHSGILKTEYWNNAKRAQNDGNKTRFEDISPC